MELNIISRNKKIFEGSISSLTLPGAAGSFQILANHAPLISTLIAGKVVYTYGVEKNELDIEQGVVSVHDNKITLLVEPTEV